MKKYSLITVIFLQNLFAQSDSLTKYFSTTIMRTNVLKGKPEKTVDQNEAHFKAIYYPSGELKSVEFLPANWDKKKRKKTRKKKRTKKKARKRRRRTRKRGGCFGNCFVKKTKYTDDDIKKMIRKASEHDANVEKYKKILNDNKIKTYSGLWKYLEENNKWDDILYATNAYSQLYPPRSQRLGSSRTPTSSPSIFERNSPPMITGAPYTGAPKQ